LTASSTTKTQLEYLTATGLTKADLVKLAAVTATAAEINLLNTSSVGTVVNSKAAVYSSAGDLAMTTGTVGTLMTIGSPGADPSGTSFMLKVGGSIRTTGEVYATALSDKRLKDNLKVIEDPLNKIKSISGYTFNWNDKQDTYTGSGYGVVAQEIEEQFPDMIEEKQNGYKGVNYNDLIPVLIEGIKEQDKKISSLEAKIEQLIKIIDTQ
jgi:hypothetical protein